MRKSLILLLLLASCADQPIVAGKSVCPKIRHYTRAEQQAQADAEKELPFLSPLNDPLLEWARLRAQLKACNGVK